MDGRIEVGLAGVVQEVGDAGESASTDFIRRNRTHSGHIILLAIVTAVFND